MTTGSLDPNYCVVAHKNGNFMPFMKDLIYPQRFIQWWINKT